MNKVINYSDLNSIALISDKILASGSKKTVYTIHDDLNFSKISSDILITGE
jgi:hypothetical protein